MKIIFEFDSDQDCKEVLNALDKYAELVWNNDTKKAMIKVFKKTKTVLVSKSITQIPNPFRL